MIIVLKPDVDKPDVDNLIKKIEEAKLKPILLEGTHRNVIAIIGDERKLPVEFWESQPGVEKSMPILAPYKIASRETKTENTVINIGDGSIGGGKIGVIAGPCAVESEEQIVSVAKVVKESGAIALRGGAYKPRTNPYSFQGLQKEGLEFLATAKKETGLPIVTEVLSENHVELVGEYADILQIGTRNMANFELLKVAGEFKKPVILKRGMAATLEEFLQAAEYILSQGNPNVLLCERGVRTFETHTRFTLSLSIVPQLKELTHLPVLVDPSHGTGKRSLVNPMSKGAIAVGADGLLIEVHHDPEASFVDGPQTITSDGFKDLIKELGPIANAVNREI